MCEHFKDTLLFGKDQTITLEEVQILTMTKKFQRPIKGLFLWCILRDV